MLIMISNIELVNTMPPSAQLIYHILLLRETQTSKELVSETRYSLRTIRYAIRLLVKARLIIKITDMTDTRRCFYAISS